jgi:hypothetical protein
MNHSKKTRRKIEGRKAWVKISGEGDSTCQPYPQNPSTSYGRENSHKACFNQLIYGCFPYDSNITAKAKDYLNFR